MKYAFIAAHITCWPVTVMCRVLKVTTSGFYAWRARPAAASPDEDDQFTLLIRQIFDEHKGAYGAPRITAELRGMGYRVNRKRVERLMREAGLCARQRRRFKPATTVADPEGPVFPDLMARFQRFWDESALGRRYHLPADLRWVRVPGHGHRPVFRARDRLGHRC
jgi:transposase InsO family protein